MCNYRELDKHAHTIMYSKNFTIGDNVTLVVREMDSDDVPVVASFEKKLFTSPWSEKTFYRLLEQKDLALNFVGVIGGEIIAYSIAWIIAPELHLANIAVIESYRRKGIAKIIMNLLLEIGKARDCHFIYLEVRRSNATAIAMYEQFGFLSVGVRKQYYEDNGEDAILMSLTF